MIWVWSTTVMPLFNSPSFFYFIANPENYINIYCASNSLSSMVRIIRTDTVVLLPPGVVASVYQVFIGKSRWSVANFDAN